MHSLIVERTARLVSNAAAQPWYDSVLAIVVAGSASRREELWYDESTLGSDVDVMFVAPTDSLVLGRRIATFVSRFAADGFEGGRVSLRALRDYRTVAYFEARATGQVVAGDPLILRQIGTRASDQIPPWEAARLVCNRMMELVRARAGEVAPENAARKVYESIGDAELVLGQRYLPTFAARRAEALARPFPTVLSDLTHKYLAAIDARRDPASAGRAKATFASSDPVHDLARVLEVNWGAAKVRNGTITWDLPNLQPKSPHLRQRAYWIARASVLGWSRNAPCLSSVSRDPIISVWSAAAHSLNHDTPQGSLRRLLRAWRSCPQVFESVRDA